MGSLHITLSILGILAIVGIVAHGLWKIRKGNQQHQQQEQQVAEKRQQHSSGFDDDGIGEVRVVSRTAPVESQPRTNLTESASEAPTDTPSAERHPQQTDIAFADDDPSQMSMNLSREESLSESLPSMRVSDSDSVDVEQTELKFDDLDTPETDASAPDVAASDPSDDAESEPDPVPDESPNTEAQAPEEVVALHVKGPVQGAVLLQMMTELGCKFGELGIFHRYETTAGTGPMIFSVANMFNPGTFDLDNLEEFETEGVAFFLTLPMNFDGQQAFNMMLNAAKKLATEIPQGQVLDGQRQLLTRQSIHEARQRIREFERKHSA